MPSSELTDTAIRELYELRNVVDELIEEGLVHRWSVSDVLGALLPRMAERLGATGAFVETYAEDLALHRFGFGDGIFPDEPGLRERTSETRRERIRMTVGETLVVAQHIDVAGSWFGRAGLVAPASSDGAALQEGLNAVCEVLDNYLFTIRAMREKHNVTMKLGHALSHRVLGEGVKQAVGVLAEAIPMGRMVIVTSRSRMRTRRCTSSCTRAPASSSTR